MDKEKELQEQEIVQEKVQTEPLLTCQEFCALQKGSRASLAVFRKTFVLNSEISENKCVKTKSEWKELFENFKKC